MISLKIAEWMVTAQGLELKQSVWERETERQRDQMTEIKQRENDEIVGKLDMGIVIVRDDCFKRIFFF